MTDWSIRLRPGGARVSRAGERRCLRIDGAALPRLFGARWPRGLGAAPADLLMLADDAVAAAMIAGAAADGPAIHLAGPNRAYAMSCDAQAMALAAGLGLRLAEALAQDHLLPAREMLAFLLKHALAPALKPFVEIKALAADRRVTEIALAPGGWLAALALRDMLADEGLMARRAGGSSAAGRLARRVPALAVMAPALPGDAVPLLVPEGRNATQRDARAQAILAAAARSGCAVVALVEPAIAANRASPAAVFDAVTVLRAAGCSRALALLLAPVLLRALLRRLPPLLGLADAVSGQVRLAGVRWVVTLRGLRLAGAFAAWGARRAGATVIDIRPELESASERYRAPVFDHVVGFEPGQRSLDRGGATAHVARLPGAAPTADGLASVAGGVPLVVSQPLTREMDRLADLARPAGPGRVRLHPQDGPAARALWARRLPGWTVAPAEAAEDFAGVSRLFTDSSNLAVAAALGGVPLSLTADAATRALIWPDGGAPDDVAYRASMAATDDFESVLRRLLAG